MANFFADKYGQSQKKGNFFADKYAEGPAALEIDESPYTVVPKKRKSFIKGEPVETIDNQREVTLAGRGILPDNPGEGALDLKDYQDISYYSADPENARAYVGRKVQQKYGTDRPVNELTRVVDGKIQYLDMSLKKPRWKEVDPGTLYSFGKPAFWGEMAGDIVGGAGGTILGTVATGGMPAGGLVAGSAASGANAYLWRKHALKRGRELGMNENLTDEDIEKMAIGYAMQTGGMTLAGGVAGNAVNAMRAGGLGAATLFGGESAKYADDVARNLRKSDAIVDDVNALRPPGADEAFDPTVAQRSKVGEIRNKEATLEAGHGARSTQDIATKLTDKRAANARVLDDIWSFVFPERAASLDELEQVGMGIRAEAYSVAGKSPEARAAREASRARKAVQDTVDNIDDVTNYDLELEKIRGVESPNGHIAGTKFYEYRDQISAKQAEKANEVIRRGANATVNISRKNLVLDDLMRIRAELARGSESLRRALGDERTIEQIDDIIRIAVEKDGQVPFETVDAIHQQLGRLVTKINKVGIAGGVNAQEAQPIADLAQVLENAIRRETRTGPARADDLVQAWDERKLLTTIKHDLYDTKAVRELLLNAEKDGPSGIQVANKIFAEKDPKYLQAIMDLAKDDPEAVASLRKMLLAKYKETVKTANGISLENHQRFINYYNRHIELLYPEQKGRPWRAVGELEKAALEAEAKAERLNTINSRAWYQVVGPKYPYSPRQLVRSLADGTLNSQQTRDLVKHLETADPDLLAFVRQEALASVRTHLGPDKFPTVKGIRSFIRSGRGDNFFTLMGKQGQTYKNNLQTLADAASLTTVRQGKSEGKPTTNAVIQVTRAAFGPLHRIQRFITAGQQLAGWANSKQTFEVLSDPARLQRALQYAAMAPHMRAVPPAILADIGALSVLFTED